MKKLTKKTLICILSLCIFGSLMAGCKKETASSKSEPKTKVVKSSDNLCQLTVPENFEDEDLQNPEAKIQLGDKKTTSFMIALCDSKKDLGDSFDLNKYYKLVSNNMIKNLSKGKISNVKDTTINGNKAKTFEMSGEVKEIKVKYFVTYVEGKNAYYQVLSWTSVSKYDEQKSTFEKIAQSLKEL